jgi:hypothetical protein
VQSALPYVSLPVSSVTKQCHKCGDAKPLAFFPRDRSRPDGRWHTCKLCNQQHGRLVRQAASEQKVLALRSLPAASRRRLTALREHSDGCRRRVFEQLPRSLQQLAWGIYQKALRTHVQRYGFRAGQPKRALLWACAVSNAQRVGDSSWSRRMKRLKGWRRQRERELLRQPRPPERGDSNPAPARASYSGVGYTPASRIRGI